MLMTCAMASTMNQAPKVGKRRMTMRTLYPVWIANPILVPKSYGKLRMCIDFSDLNKACPTDCFLLQQIDQMVGATSGQQKFEWTEECEEAFQKIKEDLTKAPILSKPMEWEDSYLYFAVSDHAISAALVREEGKLSRAGAMAKTRARQGKQQSVVKKTRKRGPTSTADVRKTKTMDAVLGIEPIDFSEEEGEGESVNRAQEAEPFMEPLSPRSSLKEIQRQEDISKDFAFFLSANRECEERIQQGNIATPPILRSGNVVRNLDNSFKNTKSAPKVKITVEDIEEEVHFWSSSIVCYVLGANPPLSIIEGFIRRVWNGKVDRVGSLSYGVFLVRFDTVEIRDEVLHGGYVFFNNRPVVMKAWDPDTNFKKEDIRTVPIWIQLPDLDLKYWGEKSLYKIVGQVGVPLQVDPVTKERNKLNYPRVLIEVSIKQEFPGLIQFEDEHGFVVTTAVTYEWKPVQCNHCKGLGHETIECRKKDGNKQQWVVKESKPAAPATDDMVDADGFQAVKKGSKGKNIVETDGPKMTNSFVALSNSFSNLDMPGPSQVNSVPVAEYGDGYIGKNRGGGVPPVGNG
uniref:DUF4283 domain-containing protein n=1 Tax=Cannabis sativa TaxID=3483 RepID=A0A803P5I8_CANSA